MKLIPHTHLAPFWRTSQKLWGNMSADTVTFHKQGSCLNGQCPVSW